jgi:pimeloyl-ACP methyl ester carboxylesterase
MKKIFLLILALCLWLAIPVSASQSQVSIAGDHGQLASILQRPDKAGPCPLVILMHGFTSSKNDPIITSLANGLEKNGVASLRFDFNGHGASEGLFQDMTVPNEIADAQKVYAYAKKLPGVTCVALAGHSQGGVVASMLAGELGSAQVKALALLAPAGVLRDDALSGNVFGIKFNPYNPPEYIEIFGGHKVGRRYIQTATTLPIYETAARYQGPACIIHGTGDQIVPYSYGERYARIYPDSELHLLPGLDHMFSLDLDQAANLAIAFLTKKCLGQ